MVCERFVVEDVLDGNWAAHSSQMGFSNWRINVDKVVTYNQLEERNALAL